jgi:two-component system cell cycle sensor histidine kinase/response regulator CckA
VRKKTILLIDDEASQRQIMRSILRKAEYKVLEGADYGEALAIHHQNRGKIDLLMTDVSLPGTNGFELGQALANLDPDLKMIFMSGPVGAEICRFYGMSIDDVRFLEKPFTGEQMLQRVNQVLGAEEFLLGAAAT